MAFVKKPVTGMRDILPDEAEVRNYVMQQIREVYMTYGFSQMETPVVEHIENLTSKQGGDNEKLIFKILKRGEKLSREEEALKNGDLDALVDSGLRYDLTVPLCRYYSNNQANLPQPFKALQMGPVFRADRPQRGRFRQFVQCDIDILGEATNLGEKEVILATTEALDRLGFAKYNYRVVINDRRILFSMIEYAGLPAEDTESILITLDKADKIGAEGVDAELTAAGYAPEQIAKLRGLLSSVSGDATAADVRKMGETIGSDEAKAACESVADIMESVQAVEGRSIRITFLPTLVRGMGYYTGTIFELQLDSFGSSVGGGGRYDKMVGKFIGQNVPAVGFSIGFERIMTILMEEGFKVPREEEQTAFLVEKGMSSARIGQIFSEAMKLRAAGGRVQIVWMAKNKKFQKENLEKQGYTVFREFYKDALKK